MYEYVYMTNGHVKKTFYTTMLAASYWRSNKKKKFWLFFLLSKETYINRKKV